jgi:RNA-binding protein
MQHQEEVIFMAKVHEKRKEAQILTPSIILGKQGLTEQVIKNIRHQIASRGLIKIKMLKSFINEADRKELAAKIALECNAEMVGIIGHMIVLGKK